MTPSCLAGDRTVSVGVVQLAAFLNTDTVYSVPVLLRSSSFSHGIRTGDNQSQSLSRPRGEFDAAVIVLDA